MANSAQVRTGLDTLIQSHLSGVLKNTLFNRMPLLYFMFAKDGQKTGVDGLGRPKVNGEAKSGIMISGLGTAKARRETILGSRVYEPIIQTSLPNVADGKVMGMTDNMPSRSNWEGKTTAGYFTRPRVKWVERADPYKVASKQIRTTRDTAKTETAAWTAIGSLFKAETESVVGVHEGWWNQTLWGSTGAGAPTDEDAEVWDAMHSIENALGTSNTYCGVDRSVAANAYWRGPTTSGFGTVANFEDLIDYTHYDLGLAAKGLNVDLILVDKDNFKKAKAEAKSKNNQHTVIPSGQGIAEFGQFGFKRELVKIDNTYIVYDPECPTGDVACLSLDTWTFAIHPDANFKVSKPFDQSQIEGGDDAMTGTIRTEMMLVCETPSANAYFTGIVD